MPIYRTSSGWKIRNVAGTSPSYGAAVKRLQAVKAHQAAAKKGKAVKKRH